MGTLKFDVPDDIEERFREWAMKRFGHKRGSIGKAGEEAVSAWVAEQDVDLEMKPARNPLIGKRGELSHVEMSSTELKHSAGKMLLERHQEKREDEE